MDGVSSPSARLGPGSIRSERPAASAAESLRTFEGSTPTMLAVGIKSAITVVIPASRPPPPVGTEHRSQVRALLGDFQSAGALPCYHVGVLERRNRDHAALAHQALKHRFALPAVTHEDDFGALLANSVDLDPWRILRHHDDGRHTEPLGRVSQRQPVIAAGVRYYTPSAVGFRETGDRGIGPAQLEGAYRLQVLALEPDRYTDQGDSRRAIRPAEFAEPHRQAPRQPHERRRE